VPERASAKHKKAPVSGAFCMAHFQGRLVCSSPKRRPRFNAAPSAHRCRCRSPSAPSHCGCRICPI
jgi:hypothetical protein